MESRVGFKAKNFLESRVVIDNSSLLRVFLNEENSEEIKILLNNSHLYKTSIFAPRLMDYEFCNILARKLEIKNVQESISKFKEIGIFLLDLSSEARDVAIKFLHKHPKISFYDAAYHALAKELETFLITSDGKYYKEMEEEGNLILMD